MERKHYVRLMSSDDIKQAYNDNILFVLHDGQFKKVKIFKMEDCQVFHINGTTLVYDQWADNFWTYK